ncbi:MAG: hypothetical protein A2010_10050 [Nitrospirae bacterium GWD2_57_9]|nr:MAG: hypothetical protein A2010_10050 [Nitrospirae bacterium GWD2_57_9]OGW49166.1 MAG: hypothetical protein A2078_04345 [Nitrospirae bacterium GWC2_57_9]
MTRGKDRSLLFPFLLALFLVASPVLMPQARAGEQGGQMTGARLAVEQSTLARDEKLLILTAGDRAVAAGVPQDDAAIIISRGLERGAGAGRTAAFLDRAARLREQDLPVRLVLDRIEQGLSKGVPPERIATVVERLSGNLVNARPLVQKMEKAGPAGSGSASEHAIETVARALEKSIPHDAIARIGEQVREQKGSIALFGRAVDTMTTFVGNGMAANDASRLVHTAMDRGYSERDLETMERYMVDELRQNRPVGDVVSGMETRMERGGMRGGMERQGGAGPRGPGSGGSGAGPGMGGRR